jgi:hypothetical protein
MTNLAYLDPATGAIVLQAVLGGILAGLFTIKLWFARVKLFFANLFGRKRASDDQSAE